MGLLDKIKDNAKTISMKAIESTREYDEDFLAEQTNGSDQSAAASVALDEPQVVTPTDDQPTDETPANNDVPATTEPEAKEEKPEEPSEDLKNEADDQTKSEKEEEKPVRKSKITEIPKEKYEKSKKPYTPHYKAEVKTVKDEKKSESKKTKGKNEESGKQSSKSKIIDIAPIKPEDNVKKAIYARERATMAAFSTQRRMDGSVPLYSTSHMNFKTRVFINRIEYSGSFGKTVLPIDKVSWVKLRHGGTGVIIETDESKRVVLVIKPADRLTFADAVIKVQALKPKQGKPVDRSIRIDQLEKFGDGIDEIEKLAKLFDKGIITEDEFEAKKKQILGI